MKIFIFINIVICSLIFLYLNIRFRCKINLTVVYVNIYFEVIILKNKFKINKKIYYKNAIKIISNIKHDKDKEKNLEKYKNYYFKFRRYFKYFIVKNISFYAECFDDNFSIAIEFYIVNNILKQSLLNG